MAVPQLFCKATRQSLRRGILTSSDRLLYRKSMFAIFHVLQYCGWDCLHVAFNVDLSLAFSNEHTTVETISKQMSHGVLVPFSPCNFTVYPRSTYNLYCIIWENMKKISLFFQDLLILCNFIFIIRKWKTQNQNWHCSFFLVWIFFVDIVFVGTGHDTAHMFQVTTRKLVHFLDYNG